MLADPAGEDERVECPERADHRPDPRDEPVDEHVDREPGPFVTAVAGGEHRSQVGAHAGEAGDPGAPLEHVVELVDRRAVPQQVEEQAGVDRTRAGRHHEPSNGVKPIVVSTLRPASTAAMEHPPPRWHETRRRSSGGTTEQLARRARWRVRGSTRGSRTGAGRRRATRTARRTRGRRRAWWRGTRCRSTRPAGRRAASRRRRGCRRVRVRCGVVQARRARRSRATTLASITTGSTKRRTAVDDPVARRRRRRRARRPRRRARAPMRRSPGSVVRDHVTVSSSPRTASFVEVDPALTTNTFVNSARPSRARSGCRRRVARVHARASSR